MKNVSEYEKSASTTDCFGIPMTSKWGDSENILVN